MGELVLKVFNPRGTLVRNAILVPSKRLDDLDGKTVGFYDNGKPGIENFYSLLGEMLRQRYARLRYKVVRGPFQINEKLARSFAKEIDAFVYAWGD